MQGHTQGGQCDLRNVNGGRLVCADGVRLGPASQGTADISDGVGGQSHPRRADGWSRAGCPLRPWRVVAWVRPLHLAGDSEQGACHPERDPCGSRPWPTHPGQDEVAGQEAHTQLAWGRGLLSRGQLAASWKETLPPGGGWAGRAHWISVVMGTLLVLL